MYVRSFVLAAVGRCPSVDRSATRRFASLTLTHSHYDESVHRIKQHTRGNNTIPYQIATLVLISDKRWSDGVRPWTEQLRAASLHLRFTLDESPLVIAHQMLRKIVSSTAQLHYFKLLCTGSSHGKSVQAPIRL